MQKRTEPVFRYVKKNGDIVTIKCKDEQEAQKVYEKHSKILFRKKSIWNFGGRK